MNPTYEYRMLIFNDRLLGLIRSSPKAHAGALTGFADEFYARGLESSRMSRRLASVAFKKPPSVSSLFIVLTLTNDFVARVAMLHPRAARDIRI